MRDSRLISVLVLATCLLMATCAQDNTPPDLSDCTRSGAWTVGPHPNYYGGMERYDCGAHWVVYFDATLEPRVNESTPARDTRARLVVPKTEDTWLMKCVDRSTGAYSEVVVLIRTPIDSYSEPHILKAWRGNLHDRKFERFDHSQFNCTLRPPPD